MFDCEITHASSDVLREFLEKSQEIKCSKKKQLFVKAMGGRLFSKKWRKWFL
jgi:hypothetical protein